MRSPIVGRHRFIPWVVAQARLGLGKELRVRFTMKELPKTLCASCRYATIIEGQRGEEVVNCRYLDKPIDFAVRSCSTFNEKNKPDKGEYEKIAWIIETKAGKVIGFVKPGTEKHADIIEED